MSRKTYLFSKWLATFVSGGLIAALPAALSLALVLIRYPFISPIIGSGHHPAGPAVLFSELFISTPALWILFCIALQFIAGGLIATLGLAVTFITDYRAVVHLLPILGMYVVETLLTALGLGQLGPITLIDLGRNIYCSPVALAMMLATIAVVGALPLLFAAKTELQ
ncbi:hypothetical protein K6V98_03465 [Collinsella sp. AGMB00827]|uniref:Uncharacterized protein n=1 Tax=Collinsella ureilytica TaxID=2869515 RepID=A0ABS7MLY0_9ACTN|nr:hypothetical protein [Collinsella urealyticum]MBY4797420.1 hypothetical protein [Collinsella urealyticum]